jgi:hypothetical protein
MIKPEEFLPWKFNKNQVDFKSRDLQFIPFGGGEGVALRILLFYTQLITFWYFCSS